MRWRESYKAKWIFIHFLVNSCNFELRTKALTSSRLVLVQIFLVTHLNSEVGSVRSVHPHRPSPKVDSFHLEPMVLRRAESLRASKPRQTALDDRITTITREDLANLEKPISCRTAIVSQYPGHAPDDTLDNGNRAKNNNIKNTRDEDNDKQHSLERDTRTPRRGSR